MTKAKNKRMISKLRSLFAEKGIIIDKIILFGSYIKEDFMESNDIDIAVVSKNFSGKGIFERAQMLGDIEWKLMDELLIPVDLIILSPEELDRGVSPVSQFVKSGEIIYQV